MTSWKHVYSPVPATGNDDSLITALHVCAWNVYVMIDGGTVVRIRLWRHTVHPSRLLHTAELRTSGKTREVGSEKKIGCQFESRNRQGDKQGCNVGGLGLEPACQALNVVEVIILFSNQWNEVGSTSLCKRSFTQTRHAVVTTTLQCNAHALATSCKQIPDQSAIVIQLYMYIQVWPNAG